MSNCKPLSAAAFVLGASICALTSIPAMGADTAGAAKKGGASQVEKIAGSSLSRVTLSPKAAQRLDIQTGKVAVGPGGMTAPYAALLYDVKGKTWVYTNPEPLVFERASVVVDSIKAGHAYLKEGPPNGTVVVVVGVAELYGAESGIGK